MHRQTITVLVFCLFLFGCVGQVITPEPIVVEKIVRETVIVEKLKPIEVTVIVEKPVEATTVREEPPTPSEALGPAQVVILVDKLNIRSGPGTKYAVIGGFTKDTTVEVVGGYQGWYKVVWLDAEGEECTGWVSGHSGYVVVNEAAQSISLIPQEEIPPLPIADTPIAVSVPTPTPNPNQSLHVQRMTALFNLVTDGTCVMGDVYPWVRENVFKMDIECHGNSGELGYFYSKYDQVAFELRMIAGTTVERSHVVQLGKGLSFDLVALYDKKGGIGYLGDMGDFHINLTHSITTGTLQVSVHGNYN